MEAEEIADVVASIETEAVGPEAVSTATVADLPAKAAMAIVAVEIEDHARAVGQAVPEEKEADTDRDLPADRAAMTATGLHVKVGTKTNCTPSNLKGGPVVGLLLYYGYALVFSASNSR